jgi:hypothetical protein
MIVVVTGFNLFYIIRKPRNSNSLSTSSLAIFYAFKKLIFKGLVAMAKTL